LKSQIKRIILLILSLFTIHYSLFTINVFAQENEEPLIVNGDKLEISTDTKLVIATGNVDVNYKGAILTCDKLTVNMQTKDGEAEGNARLDDEGGVIEGTKIIYNFQTKVGTIIDSEFRSNPYFGKAEITERLGNNEFISRRGYATTCSYDNPHYRFKSRKINLFPGDKIKTRDDIFYIGAIPVAYLPVYSHSLKDPIVHVQLMPGKNKDWGNFLLTAWKYDIAENIKGRLYLDLREKFGVAEGFGTNYKSDDFGKGDFKYYYTQERPRQFNEGDPAEFQRYFIRWRHQWEIDDYTYLTAQYYKIVDSKVILHPGSKAFLKEYFFREYEKDSQPLSYISMHHNFANSSLDVLLQKRTNRWYSQSEMLPQIDYTLPSYQIYEMGEMGEHALYFDHTSSYVNHNSKSSVPSPSFDDESYNQLSTTNGLSLLTKVAFIKVTPSFTSAQTYTDKGTFGATINNVLTANLDLSTKFYRMFNTNSNFLGLDINKLRHVITPSIGYSYSKDFTMPMREIRLGTGDTTTDTSLSLSLSNKLQTKRNGSSVDLVDFLVTNTYNINPETGTKKGSHLSNFLFELKLLPYSWLRIDADATYTHSGARDDTDYNKLTSATYDFNFNFAEERTVGIGQRYTRKGGNWITLSFIWRLNPKWKFSFYQRRNRGHDPTLKQGLREQEYTLSRDLHCWTVDFTYNKRRGEGEAIWFVFRLKAFPELEFEYNQNYHSPKPGSQSNP